MMIGPDRKRAKGKKRDRAKRAETATADGAAGAAPTTGSAPVVPAVAPEVPAPADVPAAPAEPSTPPADRPAVQVEAPTALAELLTAPEAAPTAPDAAPTASADRSTAAPAAARPMVVPGGADPDPVAGLLERVARIHDRVGGLLDLTEALTVTRDEGDGDDGDAPVGSGLPLAVDPGAGLDVAPERGTTGAIGVTRVTRTPAPRPAAVVVPEPAPAPTTSATLVARELLERGMDADGVRDRLRDGYGVPDPDAVLAALA